MQGATAPQHPPSAPLCRLRGTQRLFRKIKEKWLAVICRFSTEAGVKNTKPTTQLQVKTILNRIQHFAGFVYRSVRLVNRVAPWIDVKVEPHQWIRRRCSQCLEACPGYDTMAARSWCCVPL